MKEIQVGLIGFGTVGSGTAQVLYEQAERIKKRTGVSIVLKKVADISTAALPDYLTDTELTRDADAIINDPDIDIVIELIGGTTLAKKFILAAIAQGKHVVTANKALLSEHGMEIFKAAAEKNVEVGFEASVGGGIPLIKTLKEGLVANKILSIMGIMNGTANYILTQMTDHATPFEKVLKDAQKKGYAEADPTYDIEGIDTAHKLVILMTLAFGMDVRLSDINCEGISRIEPIDIQFAKEFGYRIKLLAISRNHGDHIEASVHPTMVPEQHMLANINGAYNGFYFTGDMVENVLLYGKGAGKMPTGSAVAADVVDISRNIVHQSINRVPSLSYLPEHIAPRPITPIEELRCPYYFRFTTLDKPGVLSKISGILGKHDISIESVIQKGRDKKSKVPIVMRTYEAQEAAVRKALNEINALDTTMAETVKIKILVDDGK
ncbi:MAG: homoserine dehydrogenase [Proteobacteria bacterium]|nr:homoserine dehydrogenase [Pseudomonadota bacterium]MBU4298262.1 homoserine dehydrogenase [Pseudomonadota bacterium]MCG2747530.1 homoserine dehydrogenase [Desulfobulbaceae bacterium]